MRHLIIRLESPLMSFGGETIDNLGVTRRFPSASMVTGLLANALGYRRTERERHQRLQDRLVFAARIDREPAGGPRLTDFQTAAINNTEQGWTTRGVPEGRGGGAYQNHLRYRDVLADMRVTVTLRLEPEGEEPTLDDLAQVLQEPARPLFIGRKPFLPSAQLYQGTVDADSVLAALMAVSIELEGEPGGDPQGNGPDDMARRRGRRRNQTRQDPHSDRPAQLALGASRGRAVGPRGEAIPGPGSPGPEKKSAPAEDGP